METDPAIGQYFHTASYLAGTYSIRGYFAEQRWLVGFCKQKQDPQVKRTGNKKAAP